MPTLAYGDFTADSDQLTQHTRDYLLQYGFSKSLQDAIGDNRRKARQMWQDAQGGDPEAMAYLAEHQGEAYSDPEGFARAVSLRAMQTRYRKIMEGTVGQRLMGPRTDPLDSMVRNIAIERLEAALKSAGKIFPTRDRTVQIGAETLTRPELIERYVTRHEADLRAEAEVRLEGRQGVNLEELV
jgi:hypothetical protein